MAWRSVTDCDTLLSRQFARWVPAGAMTTASCAFGFGIERLALRKYEITDIRRFSENDLRFLS